MTTCRICGDDPTSGWVCEGCYDQALGIAIVSEREKAFFKGVECGLAGGSFVNAVMEAADEDPKFAKRLKEEAKKRDSNRIVDELTRASEKHDQPKVLRSNSTPRTIECPKCGRAMYEFNICMCGYNDAVRKEG
jgi:hypothetical protein